MNAAGLSVVIPVFNGWAQTRRCLDALRRSTVRVRVVVVDHGSRDETAAALAQDYPEVERVAASADLWWAGATNLGVTYAIAHGAMSVMLLNNDCYVEPGAIAELLQAMPLAGEAVVSAQQVDLRTGCLLSRGLTTALVVGFPSLELPWRGRGPRAGLTRVPMIPGGRAAIVPASLWQRLGGLDAEALPHYLADHDFYLRCRRLAVPLYRVDTARVLVDDTRTTSASALAGLDWAGFRATLRDRRSHRNLRDLAVFFRRHYPVPGLHMAGVALNLARYTVAWAMARACARRPSAPTNVHTRTGTPPV